MGSGPSILCEGLDCSAAQRERETMRTVQIRVDANQAANIAEWALDKAMRGGSPCAVSDQCVVKALLALAKERGVTIQFYGLDKHLAKTSLDLPGVKRVLEGGKVCATKL